ncbi:MAG: glycosyl hydrolase [Armatimonadota bacterium]|nr:hypothetical protein [bacterium]
MLDSFKNPPAQYRRPIPMTSDRMLPMREMKREFDRKAVVDMQSSSEPASGASDVVPRPYYRLFADYTARVRYALAQGRRSAQVAILVPSTPIEGLTSEYLELYRDRLLKEHIEYAIVDEDSVRRATAIDQSLIIERDRYELLIMPPVDSVTYQAAVKIEEFVEDGGRLLATLRIPTKDSHGNKHEEVQSIFAGIFRGESDMLFVETMPADLREIVCKAIKPTVSIRQNSAECRDITYTHKICKDEELFFFANNSMEAREVRLSIRCDWAPHILDPETGERIALINCTQMGSRTIFLHRFEGCGSLLLSFTDTPSLTIPTPPVECADEINIPSQWDITIDGSQPNVARYSQIVIIPEFFGNRRAFISAEHLGDAVEFIVNGASANVRAWPPFMTDITALVKPGPNEISLKITDMPAKDSNPSGLLKSVTISIC